MSAPPLDINVVAERIANTVNQKISAIVKKMDELESRLRRLEIEVETVRASTIESVVRAVLTVKAEDIVATAIVKTEESTIRKLIDVVNDLATLVTTVRNSVDELRKMPELISVRISREVSSAISSARIAIDAQQIEQSVSRSVSDALKDVLKQSAELEKVLRSLNTTVSELRSTVSALGHAVEDLRQEMKSVKGFIDFATPILAMIQKQLQETQQPQPQGGGEKR